MPAEECGMPTGSRPTVFRWAACAGLMAASAFAADLPEPSKLPPINLGTKLPVPGDYPDLIVDPNVNPAQRLGDPIPPSVPDSAVPTGVSTTGGRGSAPVVDPAPPVVQLSVRTPSHVPTGKPVPYKVTVTNNSQSKALRVRVRMPSPTKDAAMLTKCEPLAEGLKGPFPLNVGQGDLVWEIGSLNRGESKTIDLEFQPKPEVKQIAATAYVSFEYGAKVETGIDKPKVAVKKTASPQVAVGEPATVRVEVTNSSQVPVPNAVLTETMSDRVEVRGDGDTTAIPGQRQWKLGTIGPGQTTTVTYQLLARQGGEMTTMSSLACETGGLDASAAQSVTKVLLPALQLKFDGPAKGEGKAPAAYTAVVKNAGTMPLEQVRLTINVPDDLSVQKVTNGCRTDKNPRVWVIPKLAAGEAQEFRVQVVPEQGTSGRRTLKASARDGSGRTDAQTREAITDFVGRADLSWKPTFTPGRLPVQREGTITVLVRNHGSETDKGVRLRVMLPPEVTLRDAVPSKASLDPNDNTLVFPPQPVAPGKTVEFTVTYQAKSPGQAQFRLLLEGESLDKAVTKDQAIEIER